MPLSAGKITIDVSDYNSFKALGSLLDRWSLGGLEFWSVASVLVRIVPASSFFKIVYCTLYSSYNIFLRQYFRRNIVFYSFLIYGSS